MNDEYSHIDGDYGEVTYNEDNHISLYVWSISYLAIEVILGLPYDMKIDIWSLGYILAAELCNGNVRIVDNYCISILCHSLLLNHRPATHFLVSCILILELLTCKFRLSL